MDPGVTFPGKREGVEDVDFVDACLRSSCRNGARVSPSLTQGIADGSCNARIVVAMHEVGLFVRRSIGGAAAGEIERRPGGEAVFVPDHEGNHRCGFFYCNKPPTGHLAQHVRYRFRGQPLQYPGLCG